MGYDWVTHEDNIQNDDKEKMPGYRDCYPEAN
jgi:hypothetical protein